MDNLILFGCLYLKGNGTAATPAIPGYALDHRCIFPLNVGSIKPDCLFAAGS